MEVISVLLVGSIVTYFMYQNINKITSNLALEKSGTFEEYAAFAAKVTEHIRKVKNDLDKDITCSDPLFCPKEDCDAEQSVKELLDLLRSSAFYETVMAKRKTPKEVEAAMAEILQKLDAIIRKSCVDGDKLADMVRDRLYEEYQKIGA
jgi:hypothetical protein